MEQIFSTTTPIVAICMATYNPKIEHFSEQISSIINQTYQNWICIINDDFSDNHIFEEMKKIILKDNRFQIYRNKTNLGFYYNFEKVLKMVPENVELIALSDQDDYWHNDKLSILIDEFDKDTNLVFSDVNIVDSKRNIVYPTYWNDRNNNYEKLDLLLFANTVTGAASVFRKKILEIVLPFPKKIGDSYHDWWIACVSLACGKIKYINKSLYDYRQHDGNVLGHFTKKRLGSGPKIFDNDIVRYVSHNLAVYNNELLRVIDVAQTLKIRCSNLTPAKQKIINEISNYQYSSKKLFFKFLKSKFRRKRITLGAEERLFKSLLITKWYTKYLKWDKNARLAKFLFKNLIEPNIDYRINSLNQKIAPLKLEVSVEFKTRINIIISIIDFRYFFGGYISIFNIAQELANQGKNIRIIIVDQCDYNPKLWRREIKAYAGLERFFDKVEIMYVYDRSNTVQVNDNDIFLATSWWTAHIANDTLKYLNRKKFIFLIQEYEPLFYSHETFYVLAQQAYTFPHFAIFSTEFLRQYFKQNRIGIFKENIDDWETNSISFENAITKFEINENILKNKEKMKLLFYARPEPHAARNMFDLGILALSEAIKNHCFDSTIWEFHGIGSVTKYKNIHLSENIEMKLLPRVSLDEYKQLLPQYDIGLSLMLTPHPNLVTIEMASAGMITITNNYENKNHNTLSQISSNILSAEPTRDDIGKLLCNAVKLVANTENRVRGSKVNWATTWKDSLNEEKMKQILQFIKMC